MEHFTPQPQQRRSMAWIHLLVWTIPTLAAVATLYVVKLTHPPGPWPIWWLPCLGLIGYLAHFDAMLKCEKWQIRAETSRSTVISEMVDYFFGQLSIVPCAVCSFIALMYVFVGGLGV